MKIQLSKRSYLEDQNLIIQLTKKLLMQPLVYFNNEVIQLSSFLKLINSSKSEVLQSPPYIFFLLVFFLFNILIFHARCSC